LAATVASAEVADAFWSDDPQATLMHGPTYMANPLGCSAANASLDLFETEPRLEQVGAIASQMETELAACRGLPGVKDVRVKGAIGVVELEKALDLNALKARFVELDVWIRPLGRTIYLTPAFTISPEELSALTGAIHQVACELAR
ncbi:MAG TPA: aminotransferase class III-fold pyridoxal phosphate-dependent enzyme, partial [Caulobacteraceae bacterium]|nr:aminotransferase class III-fold pyridoxal phosphate-dependent enzyme [Caulobacteraceae bacterium]